MFGNRDKECQNTFFHPSTQVKKYFLKLYCLFDVAIFNMLGTNAVFDLGLKIIPGGSFFTLLSSLRYAVNSVVFLVSMYHSYESMQLNVNESAEKVLDKANEAIILLEEIIARDSQLLNEGGYASHAKQDTLSVLMHENKLSPPLRTSIQKNATNLYDYLHPFLNVTTKIAGILSYPHIRYHFLCIPALATAYFSLQKFENDHKVDAQKNILKKKLQLIQLKLNELDQQLGTEEELKQMFSYAAQMTNRKIPMHALDSDLEIRAASPFFKFLESKPLHYLSSLFQGFMTALNVKMFLEFISSERLYLHYALSTCALLKVTHDHLQIKDHLLLFLDEITVLSKKLLDIQNKKLNLAKAILFCQKEYLENPLSEEIPVMEYEEDLPIPSVTEHGTMRFFSKDNTALNEASHHSVYKFY